MLVVKTLMHPKGLALTIATLLALIYCPTSFAVSHRGDLKTDLVVVLNKNPSNLLGGEIWFVSLEGRLIRRITKNNYHEEHPRFSPDGTKIAFVRNVGRLIPGKGLDAKRNEIFVYDLRTRIETRLTRNDIEDGHPDWSNDGKHIAFHSRRNHPSHKATLWIMGSDGSRPRQVSPLLSGDLSHTDPVWAPDGFWLAFVNHREESGIRFSRVEKIRRDGTQRTVLSSGGRVLKSVGSQEGNVLGDFDSTFSPDGAMICSARRLQDGRVRLFTYGANTYYGGKAEIEMNLPVRPEGVDRSPQFSPDGRRLVFTSSSPKAGYRTRQLVLTDPDASFRRRLLSRVDWDVWDPSWHPSAISGAERETSSPLVSYSASQTVGSKTLTGQKDRRISADARRD